MATSDDLSAEIDTLRRWVTRAGAAGMLVSTGCVAGEFPGAGDGSPTRSSTDAATDSISSVGGGSSSASYTYELEASGQVSAAVYDSDGTVVRTLLRGVEQETGDHTVTWDGLDRNGDPYTGEFTIKVLRTPGFTAEFVTELGTNPDIPPTDPAYEANGVARGGRVWVGNYSGPKGVAVDDTGVYLTAGSEFTRQTLHQSHDGTEYHWGIFRHKPWAYSGKLAAAVTDERLYLLKHNAYLHVVDPDTGDAIETWDVHPDDAEREDEHSSVFDVGAADIAADDDTVVLSLQEQGVVRWLDTDGATREELDLPSPRGVTVGPNGGVFVVSEQRVLQITPDDGVRSLIEDGLVAPHRLAVEPTTDDLLVAEGDPDHRVKRFARDGTLKRTYGREGGRQEGTYEATDFRGVEGIAADGDSGFYIVEPGGAPRRATRVANDGTIRNEWYGGTAFFTWAVPDPRDASKVWYNPGHGWIVLAEVDYESAAWSVKETYHVAELAGELTPSGIGGNKSRPQVRYRDGERYLVFETVPPTVAIHREGTLQPVVAGGTARKTSAAFERATALNDPGEGAKGFLWSDRNGDRTPQADELRFADSGLVYDGLKGPDIDRGFSVLGQSASSDGPRSGTLTVDRLPNTGWVDSVPTYDLTSEAIGSIGVDAGSNRFYAPGILERSDGGHYALVDTKMDKHGHGWPEKNIGGTRLVRLDDDGTVRWNVGRHAVRKVRAREARRTGQAGRMHAPTGIIGEARDTVVVADRVVNPAMAWTADGLYAGSFLDHSADDGLPGTLYRWHEDPETGASSILAFDNEAMGNVAVREDGEVIWFAQGWQNAVIYRITGWDGWSRREDTVTVSETPPHPAKEGSGLRGTYYANDALEGDPAVTRTDGQLWFETRRFYKYPAATGGAVWGNEGPAPDAVPADGFSARWRGEVEAPLSEAFVFSTYQSGGGARLWVDGEQRISGWNDVVNRWETEPIQLRAGERYPIQVEFYSGAAEPAFSLNWESSSRDRQRIPETVLYPEPQGDPLLVRRSATDRIDARSFFDHEGQVSLSAGGVRLGYPPFDEPIPKVGYNNLDFGDGVTQLRASLHSWKNQPAVEVSVRLDAPDGTEIGTLTSPPTGELRETTTTVESVSGVHDLYLLNPNEGGRWTAIDWLTFN